MKIAHSNSKSWSSACLQLAVALVSVAQLSRSCHASARTAQGRALRSWPPVLDYPFAYPRDVAISAQEAARSKGSRDAYAEKMCKMLANPKVKGSRRFSMEDSTKIYYMLANVVRAAYGYPDVVVDVWAAVFSKCNSMGGAAAENVGFGVSYMYAEGMFEAAGVTKVLERAYKAGGCKAIRTIMDVAAAVLTTRQQITERDALYTVMPSYSKVLQSCTPKDKDQKYKPGTAP